MKVYADDDGGRRLLGHADVPDDCGPVFELPPSGRASVATEEFAVVAVTRLPAGGGAPVVKRAVLVAPGQLVELLPGWVQGLDVPSRGRRTSAADDRYGWRARRQCLGLNFALPDLGVRTLTGAQG